MNSTPPNYGIQFEETAFWVIHRRQTYGLFDYQWSGDLDGIEFLYRGEKYGECCSSDEFFADLKPFRLPTRVAEVATVVTGTITQCIFRGIPQDQRRDRIDRQLLRSGLGRYDLFPAR